MDTTYAYLGGHLNQVHCTRPKNVKFSNAKCLGATPLSSFLFSSWHCKTRSVPVNTGLQWGMDLTPGKYLPLAKANTTKV